MLGLRLDVEMEQRLGRFADQTHRSKSDIARDAVREYLDRHALDAEIKRQLAAIAAVTTQADLDELDRASEDALRGEPDYDWGAAPR